MYLFSFFSRYTETEGNRSITLKKINQPTDHAHINAIDSISVVQPPQFNEWSTVKYRAMQTNLQVQFLIEFSFCLCAVSNLSSEVCLGPIKHARKPCTEIHDLEPSSYCALTTLPNYRSISLLSESALLLLLLVAFITHCGTKNGEDSEHMDIPQPS